MRAALDALNSWALRNPLSAAVGVGGTKNGVCDACVQVAASERFDWRRNAIFVAFGLGYVGAAQYMVFNRIFPRLLPSLNGAMRWRGVLGAVALDNFVHIPFFYLPTFYCMREFANGEAGRSPREVLQAGLRWHREHFFGDVSLQACIFVPVQLMNFGFNPPHLRVPTVVAAGVVWISALSLLRGNHDERADA
jgi:hypothetical protein